MKDFKTMPKLNKKQFLLSLKASGKALLFTCNLQKESTFFHKLKPENFFLNISEEYIGLIYKLV